MVDTCFFGHTKNKDKKKLKSLPPILHPLSFSPSHTAYFASSQFSIVSQNNIVLGNYFSLSDKLIFLVLSEIMYLLAPPT